MSKMETINVETPENSDESGCLAITRDTIIGDIITKYPYAVEVFMDYGIHCVGCSASSFETMAQGILGHGFSEGELMDIIKELNDMVANPPEDFEDLVY